MTSRGEPGTGSCRCLVHLGGEVLQDGGREASSIATSWRIPSNHLSLMDFPLPMNSLSKEDMVPSRTEDARPGLSEPQFGEGLGAL